VLQKTSLIIWDKAFMMEKEIYECIDRSLQDLLNNKLLFGGICCIFSGDARQILPVKKKASPNQIVGSTLKYSYIWPKLKKLQLTTNMRALRSNSNQSKILEWSKYLLNVGNGSIQSVPIDKFKVAKNEDELLQILNHKNSIILTCLNQDAKYLNNLALEKMPGETIQSFSIDSICEEELISKYSTEFLNSISNNEIPEYELNLKKKVPIMLMRNLNPSNGLCNGTRLIVENISKKLIEATIDSGTYSGQKVFLPRIPFVSSENLSFQFKRFQFPVKIAYCIII
jgi:hypothetical protein